MPKKVPRLNAVSAVVARLPFTIPWMDVRGIPLRRGKLALAQLMRLDKLLVKQSPGSGVKDGFLFADHGVRGQW